MRFRLLLLFLPLLLGACSKTAAPVRLDFIGTTTLTSGNRTVSPNDTLTTRAFASGNDNLLTNLRITVKYEPTRNPILYPVPLSGYDPSKALKDDELVYLDSTLMVGASSSSRGGDFLMVNGFVARSTSGTELWQYTATDAQQQSASRAYRLTARKSDSAAVFHNYSVLFLPVPLRTAAAYARRDRARVYLSLRSGLLLPKYAVSNNQNSLQANQQLVDAVCIARGDTISLEAAAAPSQRARLPAATGRRTRLLRTTLTIAQFNAAVTTASFNTAYAAGTPFSTDSLSSGRLAANNVLAFKTAEGYTGLILVNALTAGTAPLLNCSIKVQK